MQISKKTISLIPWILLGIAVIVLFFKITSTGNLETKIATLEAEAKIQDSISDSHIAKYEAVELSRQEITKNLIMYKAKYEQSEKEKSIIRKERDEKIKIIGKYSVSDMQRYWDTRYSPAN